MAGSPPVEHDVRREVPGGTVTFLFTDIESSTKLLERLRGEYATLLADHGEILRSTAIQWNGHEVDTQGDAFFITFSRATDAVACVIAAQRALAAHRWPQGASVRVRMGLHTGEALISNSKYVGMDVHLAARIASAGHGGQVLLSQSTQSLIDRDLPRGATLRDLGPYELKDIRRPQQIYQLDIAGLPSDFPALKTLGPVDEPPLPGEPPFKGLQYFDEGDAELFFGREQVTATLAGDLRDQRFLAVVGASGSGKSSVVRAGLVPALRQGQKPGQQAGGAASRWKIEIITPGAHPLEALATSLTRGSESVTATATLIDDLARDARSLHLYARRDIAAGSNIAGEGRDGARLLLVVDQFEELFTLCRNEDERRAFVDNIVHAVETEGGATTVVISLRADFYPHLSQYDRLRALVAKHQEFIGPMSAAELRKAMEEPAQRGGWVFTPGLVDLLLHDIGAAGDERPEPGALPLLSHALLETWRRRRGDMMTIKGYAEAGGVRGAIAHSAERVYNQELTVEQQAIARNIFLRLTELGEGTQDTRRRVARSELIPPAPSSGAAEVEAVLVKLADARLITTGEGTVEVAHEALIREWPALREWLTQDREGLRQQRRLTEAAEEWERLGRDDGALYRGTRLAQAQEWAATSPREMNMQEWAFLQASKALADAEQLQREAHRLRELEAAQKLAEAEGKRAQAERRRAEEQHGAAQQLRRRAAYLVGVLILALVFAAAATGFAYQANQNEQRANDLATRTESERRIAFARELAGTSMNNLDVDPERSILLALQAVAVSSSGGKPVREAEDALHRAVQASRLQLTLLGHTSGLTSLALSPDGTRLATSSADKTAMVWDAATGKELLTLVGHTDAVRDVAFSPDGTRLATASADKTAKVWDAATGRLLFTVAGHTNALWAIAIGPDATRLATASGDKTAKVWDGATGKELLTLVGHTDAVRGIAFSPDGTRLVTGSNDKTARVWDAGTGKELLTLAGHNDNVVPVAFSPDGTRLATGGFDGTTKIWDAASGRELSNLLGVALASQNDIAFNRAGTRLATCTGGGVAAIWDVATEQIVLVLHGHAAALNGCAFSPDGTRLATSSGDKTAKVWDVSPAGSREWLTFAGHIGGVYDNRVRAIAYSPDGKYLASASQDRTAKIWDAANGRELLTLVGHTDALRSISFSPDGKRVATISDDLTARVWDTSTGQALFTLPARALVLGFTDHSVAFSPDGLRLAVESDGNTAKVWDAASGRELLTLSGHTSFIHAIAFSPDGKRLATASDDSTAKVWDAATGKELLTLLGHAGRVYDVAFSPDGARLVTAGLDGTAKLWDAATGKELFPLPGHTAVVFAVAFSPDGTRVATASADTTVKVWNVSSGIEQRDEPLTLYGHTAAVYDVVFSPDGQRLATASKDGTSRVYALPIDDLVTIAKLRLTRALTTDECQKFLHVAQCPVAP